MGRLPKATKRRVLIKRFRALGWTGPHKGVGDHPQYMEKAGRTVKIPNPHASDIGEGLLKMILDQAGISADEWVPTEKGRADDHVEEPATQAGLPNGHDANADDTDVQP